MGFVLPVRSCLAAARLAVRCQVPGCQSPAAVRMTDSVGLEARRNEAICLQCPTLSPLCMGHTSCLGQGAAGGRPTPKTTEEQESKHRAPSQSKLAPTPSTTPSPQWAGKQILNVMLKNPGAADWSVAVWLFLVLAERVITCIKIKVIFKAEGWLKHYTNTVIFVDVHGHMKIGDQILFTVHLVLGINKYFRKHFHKCTTP